MSANPGSLRAIPYLDPWTLVDENTISIRARNGLPAYQKIQGAVRRVIESGGLRPGDAVPSERKLARLHDVSLMTARHALATLEQEGVVERRRGIGTFVSPPKPFQQIDELLRTDEGAESER
jgi:GntR family transcriptional regulator